MQSHALAEPALAIAIEVFAANEQNTMIQAGLGYTPTPVISHAILTYNYGKTSGLADGVVITPSHNPPALMADTTHEHDYIAPYVADLRNVINIPAIVRAGLGAIRLAAPASPSGSRLPRCTG